MTGLVTGRSKAIVTIPRLAQILTELTGAFAQPM